MDAPPITSEQFDHLLQKLAYLAFTRPRKNFNRDFSDGVLVAELAKHFQPKLVQLHNYQSASSASSKFINWKTLNDKVFKKLGFQVSRSDIQAIIQIVPGAMERVLSMIFKRLSQADSVLDSERNKQALKTTMEKINTINQYAQELSGQLANKEDVIKELRDTILILQNKIKKMEQLNKLKDNKIQSLMRKLEGN